MKRPATLLLPLLLFLTIFSSSCEKEELIYELTVLVTVEDSIPVQNALIHIYAPVNETFIDFFTYTDENGEVFVDLDNKAILQLVAQKGSYRGCNVAEVNRGRQTVRVDVKPFGQENGCDGL